MQNNKSKQKQAEKETMIPIGYFRKELRYEQAAHRNGHPTIENDR